MSAWLALCRGRGPATAPLAECLPASTAPPHHVHPLVLPEEDGKRRHAEDRHGEEPVDSYDKFVEKWKSAGGNQITAEVKQAIS